MKNKTLITLVAIALILGAVEYATLTSESRRNAEDSWTDYPSRQGKLNIDVACESALAYTTFTDAESAAMFVQECKEGKHPEVIERYIKDTGLNEDSVI